MQIKTRIKLIVSLMLSVPLLMALCVALQRWRIIDAWEQNSLSHTTGAVAQFVSEHEPMGEVKLAFIAANGQRDLTEAAAILPQTQNYRADDIRMLYAYAQTCKNAPVQVASGLVKTLKWSRILCGALTPPPLEFFKDPPFIHPAGHSFAFLAAIQKKYPLASLLPYLHRQEFSHLPANLIPSLSEPERFSVERLRSVDSRAIEMLGRGKNWVVSEFYVFRRIQRVEEDYYLLYDRSLWQHFWNDRPLIPVDTVRHVPCMAIGDDFCWSKNSKFNEQLASIVAGVTGSLLICSLLWIGWLYYRRRQQRNVEMAERLLMLQLLTHELRTPVTSMRVDLDLIRKEIGGLSEGVQAMFLRLTSSVQRLMRTLRASEGYLSTFTRGGVILDQKTTLPSVNDFILAQLDAVFQGRSAIPENELKLLEADRSIQTNPEILAICMRNLIENAVTHGRGKLTIAVEIHRDFLCISVSDQGNVPFESAKSWGGAPFKKSATSPGLGLGLFLVRTFMKRLGGSLTFSEQPTTFTLQIPTDGATP